MKRIKTLLAGALLCASAFFSPALMAQCPGGRCPAPAYDSYTQDYYSYDSNQYDPRYDEHRSGFNCCPVCPSNRASPRPGCKWTNDMNRQCYGPCQPQGPDMRVPHDQRRQFERPAPAPREIDRPMMPAQRMPAQKQYNNKY